MARSLARALAFTIVGIGFVVHWWLPQKLGFRPGWERRG